MDQEKNKSRTVDFIAERLLLLIGFIGVPMEGVVSGAYAPDSNEIYWLRFVFSGISGAVLLLSFLREKVKSNLPRIAHFLAYAFILHISYLNYAHKFAFDVALLLMTALIICSIYFKTVRSLLLFLVVSYFISSAAMLLTDNPAIPAIPFIGRMAIACVASFAISRMIQVQTEKLEQSNADLANKVSDLNKFSYIVSHDLKTPLRGIGSVVHWIQEDLEGRLDPTTERNLGLIEGRVQRMENLIEGILAYSKIDHAERQTETVDLNALLNDLVPILENKRKLRIEIPDDLPEVKGIPTHLYQVFQNLIGNAIKYHDKEGDAGFVRVRWTQEGDEFEFFVEDNGPGIEKNYQEKIFEIFQTLEARDKRESTGIGLAIVKKITRENGGAVSVESEPGKGSVFRFTWKNK